MRIGTFLIGGVIGAAAVMLFNRSSNRSNLSVENGQNLWNAWLQRMMNMRSIKPSTSKDSQLPTTLTNESLINSSMASVDSKHLDQGRPAN